jgi:hypothetical protein
MLAQTGRPRSAKAAIIVCTCYSDSLRELSFRMGNLIIEFFGTSPGFVRLTLENRGLGPAIHDFEEAE